MKKQKPIDATLLRPDPNPTTITTNPLPLFHINSNNPQYNNWVGNPPGVTTYTGQFHDISRNSYFDNQAAQKIGSLLTTRSNCFAVWITIGYFEMEDYRTPSGTVVIDAAHPDGLALGQEIGADSGEITRHRAFYIIDRSIPVGFMPGSRLNTDDCVLVRRLIE